MYKESSIAYCGCTKDRSRSFIQCGDFTCNRMECFQCIMIRLGVNREQLTSWAKPDNYSFRCNQHQQSLGKRPKTRSQSQFEKLGIQMNLPDINSSDSEHDGGSNSDIEIQIDNNNNTNNGKKKLNKQQKMKKMNEKVNINLEKLSKTVMKHVDDSILGDYFEDISQQHAQGKCYDVEISSNTRKKYNKHYDNILWAKKTSRCSCSAHFSEVENIIW